MREQHLRNKDNQELVIYTLPVGQLQANCYILAIGNTGYIVDPGDEGDYIVETAQRLGVKPQAILLTHGHFDHVLAAFEVGMAFGIATYIKKEDQFLIDRMQQTAKHYLNHSVHELPPQPLLFYTDANVQYEKIHIIPTPGHTPGSVSIQISEFPVVFTGDTLFAGGFVGDTNHPYSSKSDLQKSLALLYALDRQTIIFPGHGESTLLYETVPGQ